MPQSHDTEPYVFHRGPFIVSVESLFWHWQKYPRRRIAPLKPPLTELASPREVEDPFRRGEARIFRFPLTRRAIVVGYWLPAEDDVLEEEQGQALLQALDGAHIPGITATEIAAWARPRFYSLWERFLRWAGIQTSDDQPDRSFHYRVSYDDTEQRDPSVPEVIPWDDDTPVIDIEEARVRGVGAIQSMWAVHDAAVARELAAMKRDEGE